MDDMREIENRINNERVQEEIIPEPVVMPDPNDVSKVVSETSQDALPISETAPDSVDKECITTALADSTPSSSAIAKVDDSTPNLAAPAVTEVAQQSMAKAKSMVNDPKNIARHANDLAKVANDLINNQIDTQRLKNEKDAAKNKVERKNIANALYKARQEGIRLRKEAKHQSKMQKERHRLERQKLFWDAHKDTLEQYKMHEGSPRIACEILLWLDGAKGFFNGIGKVSDSILKALKWVLIFGGAFGVLMIFPATRNWILSILGFIK